ncbi:onanonoxo-7-onima-8-eninoihtemlysoneda [Cordyceps fumosorosea ARSEF 2679]|uniref:Onanonoxo-7-onima-8-eninoihtemlysoneda n=1 Tax=Cordyceps fumosorosea (strain ARSEF 2679) TaxID=1081104 RepID=A0A167VYI9_CORFA|nr:onanonoxo-7-onima-8-eninoihtemlysoneda [Cordyceps fumosorosea ARSEF 2679]OAA63123.1 onanonoxo-7-onima-8-eninoihtemlysoneda [Cordyceps fumosorosea ARSEF 2679]
MESPLAALLWRSLRVYQVFGANTEVGKTVFTTLLCKSAKHNWKDENVSFLKPVSTGPLNEADDQSRCREHASERAKAGKGWLFMETAGGVHSPGPSGTTQADLYTPLRAPVVLVGDAKLGGISQTIASFEALRIRGYDVQSIMLFQDKKYQNYLYLADYFSQKYNIPVMSLQEPPARLENEARDVEAMKEYYEQRTEENVVGTVLQHLDSNHTKRLARLESMATKAHETIWYPFTQHGLLPAKDIMTIDSAHGDYFQTYNSGKTQDQGALQASFDGSASWWTQGLGHANSELTMAAAYAAGRYGHVMFAGAIHEPALTLAEDLLRGTNNSRLTRVFYSDNGSTGTEVAVKMGLRAARVRYGWGADEKLGVLGLRGGYHGDTIGAMDCAEPCVYNENIEWYEGKGYWFDYPTILCREGTWRVGAPEGLEAELGRSREYESLRHIFDVEGREEAGEHEIYEKFIIEKLEALKAQGRKFGALIMEPIVLGAGGMAFVDPLFQRTLVKVIRRSPHLFTSEAGVQPRPESGKEWSGLPVLFDEVFTGLYRLGRFTPSTFLGVEPDVTVNAKLLTGGLVPLSTTMASEDIFRTFRSPEKVDALLHGHSYTAHPIGCQVGIESLKAMRRMERRGAWDWAKNQGWTEAKKGTEEVWSVWPRGLVEDLSRMTARVEGVWALGSVLAVHLRDEEGGAGYSSDAALGLRAALAEGETEGRNGPWNVHARVLGNVIYLMASQTTTREGVEQLSKLLVDGLR